MELGDKNRIVIPKELIQKSKFANSASSQEVYFYLEKGRIHLSDQEKDSRSKYLGQSNLDGKNRVTIIPNVQCALGISQEDKFFMYVSSGNLYIEKSNI